MDQHTVLDTTGFICTLNARLDGSLLVLVVQHSISMSAKLTTDQMIVYSRPATNSYC